MDDKQALERRISDAISAFVLSRHSSSKVVADFSPVIDATSELPLENLDYWERFLRNEYYKVLVTTTNGYGSSEYADSSFITWFDLCNGDGHRRERALRTLGRKAPNRFFLALVLRRLNDWVPQVRQVAIGLLPKIMAGSEPVHVADVTFFTLCHWSSWQRIDNVSKDMFLHAVSCNGVAERLKSRLITTPSGPLGSVLSQLGRIDVLDEALFDIAKSAVQPSLRARAYRCLFEQKIHWLEGKKWQWLDIQYGVGRMAPIITERELSVTIPFMSLLSLAADDRSSIVRRVAAEMVIRNLDDMGEASTELAERFILDNSPAVAEKGRYVLKKLAGETIF